MSTAIKATPAVQCSRTELGFFKRFVRTFLLTIGRILLVILALAFGLPIILLPLSTPVLAEEYFELLNAPHKELIWFERSGHNPWVTESSAFVDAVVNKVLAETYPNK